MQPPLVAEQHLGKEIWLSSEHVCFVCSVLCCVLSAAPCCTVVWGIETRNCNKNHTKPIKKHETSPARVKLGPPKYCQAHPISQFWLRH